MPLTSEATLLFWLIAGIWGDRRAEGLTCFLLFESGRTVRCIAVRTGFVECNIGI
jgi:hypothetical protein